jgi:hypothetical protein
MLIYSAFWGVSQQDKHIHIPTSVYTHIHIHTSINTNPCTHITSIYTHPHPHPHIHTSTSTSTHTHIHKHTSIYTHMYTHSYTDFFTHLFLCGLCVYPAWYHCSCPPHHDPHHNLANAASSLLLKNFTLLRASHGCKGLCSHQYFTAPSLHPSSKIAIYVSKTMM